VFRSPAGRVTVEVKRGSGPETMLAALRDAIARLKGEFQDSEAA
jgi:hypothetical protein